jgi:hypothetical protein
MVALDRQTREDREVNGTRAHYPYKSSNWRHPFVLYVDGVVGSVDSIHRTKLTISSLTRAISEPSLVQRTSLVLTPSPHQLAKVHPGAR